MRIAVVGSGVSGLAAFWALRQSGKHHVEIFEKQEWLGGHAHTVEVKRKDKKPCWVETAFLLIHQPGWPNFTRFLSYLNIPLEPSNASFSLSREGGDGIAWASWSLWSLFGQWKNIINPDLYRMLFDIFRFNYFALDVLRSQHTSSNPEWTIKEYLLDHGYSRVFREDYLLLWGKPTWYTIKGGSKTYVDRLMGNVPASLIHKANEVKSVTVRDGGVTVQTGNGEESKWDHVILATHSDTSRCLLESGNSLDPELKEILAPCEWSDFDIWIHWDETAMPKDKRVWAAWNDLILTRPTCKDFHDDSKSTMERPRSDYVSVTFDMNILQNLPIETHGQIFETLNPAYPLDPNKVSSIHRFAQPVINPALIRSQQALTAYQAKNPRGRLSIVGAWTGFGFHEDGFTSGLQAVLSRKEWEVELPFDVVESRRPVDSRIGVGEVVGRGIIEALGWIFGIIGKR